MSCQTGLAKSLAQRQEYTLRKQATKTSSLISAGASKKPAKQNNRCQRTGLASMIRHVPSYLIFSSPSPSPTSSVGPPQSELEPRHSSAGVLFELRHQPDARVAARLPARRRPEPQSRYSISRALLSMRQQSVPYP